MNTAIWQDTLRETYQDELGIMPNKPLLTQQPGSEDDKMIENLRLYLTEAKRRRTIYNAMWAETSQEKKLLKDLRSQTEEITDKVTQYLSSEVTPNLSSYAKTEHEALIAPLIKLRNKEKELTMQIRLMNNQVEEKRMKLTELQKMKKHIGTKRQDTEEKRLIEQTVNQRYENQIARVQSEIQTLLLQ